MSLIISSTWCEDSKILILVSWVISQLIFSIDRSFGSHVGSMFYVDPEDGTCRCSETSANKQNTPGNNQKTIINHSGHGDVWNLDSKILSLHGGWWNAKRYWEQKVCIYWQYQKINKTLSAWELHHVSEKTPVSIIRILIIRISTTSWACQPERSLLIESQHM